MISNSFHATSFVNCTKQQRKRKQKQASDSVQRENICNPHHTNKTETHLAVARKGKSTGGRGALDGWQRKVGVKGRIRGLSARSNQSPLQGGGKGSAGPESGRLWRGQGSPSGDTWAPHGGGSRQTQRPSVDVFGASKRRPQRKCMKTTLFQEIITEFSRMNKEYKYSN